MSTCLSKNLFNSICKYINNGDITNFSLTNKYFYSFFNPENNPYINTFYRDLTFKLFFNINNKKNNKLINEEFLLDDFNQTKNNWKIIFQKLKQNSENFTKKEIIDEIYKCFKMHCYMPYQRKENKIIEYENSTLHQIICYDMNKNDFINKKYYDKFSNNKNEKYEKNKIEPLRKGLFFEEELINFKSEVNNYDNKKIMKMITGYSFKKLNNVYYSIMNKKNNKKSRKNKKKYTINSIYFFIIWLNHTFILFINLLYHYVYQFRNIQDPKKLIIEYSKTHSNLINFGLMINEKFNNINFIFNFLQENSSNSTNNGNYGNNRFKIYDMFLNIMEKNFYQKLKPLLNINIEKIIRLFSTEYLEKEKMNNCNNCHSIETNDTEQINKENDNIDDSDEYDLNVSFCEEIDMQDDEDLNDKDGLTYKEIIEEYSNLILDFSINKDNASYINHSKIKLNGIYNEYEKLIGEYILGNIKKNLFKDKEEMNGNNKALINEGYDSLCSSFSFIKKLFGKEEKGGFKLINRTKLNIFDYCFNNLFNYLKIIMNNKYKYENKLFNIKEPYFLDKESIITFNDDEIEQNIIYELYINELNNKNKLILDNNKNIKDKNIAETIENLIINYLNLNIDEIDLKILTKDISLYLYKQIELFNLEDTKIIDISFKIEDKKIFYLLKENSLN